MILTSPVQPLYDESAPVPSELTIPDPPQEFVASYWNWDAPLGGSGVNVHTGRLISELRAVAARRDPTLALVDAALANMTSRRILAREGRSAAWNKQLLLSQAFADLAVSGRATYDSFLRLAPTDAGLVPQVREAAARRSGLARLTDAEVIDSVHWVLDRAYTVIWALRGAPAHRRALRPLLGWIAVSSEDDPPHAPTNLFATGDVMGELHVSAGPLFATCRAAIKLPHNPPDLPQPEIPTRSLPTAAGRQFQDLLTTERTANYDELILFVHGLGSTLEEGDRFKQRLIEHGRARGRRYAVLSCDLPNCGYSSRLSFDQITGGVPAQFDAARPSRSRFPFLLFFRRIVAQIANLTGGGYQYVVGGSLGGNLVLMLAESGFRGGHVVPDSLQKALTWSPASIWESYARAPAIDLPKHGSYVRTRTRMNESETDNRRFEWFDWIQRGEEIAPGIRRDGWRTRSELDRSALIYLSEVYCRDWRRTFWALSHEQSIFSHQEPVIAGGRNGDRIPFRTINRPLYIMAGSNDTGELGAFDYYTNVIKVTEACPEVPGRRLLLCRTGHSIHEERPDLLASHAVRFFTDHPTFRPDSGMAALSPAAEHLEIFAIANDGRLYQSSWRDGRQWTSLADAWKSIGGWFAPTARPSAVARANGDTLDVFCIAEDGHAYTNFWREGISDWTGVNDAWTDLGGLFPPSAPIAALSRTPGVIDLFAIGGDGRVYTKWWTESGWSGWVDLGGGTFPAGAPVTALARSPEHLDLFVVGNDGGVHHCSWNGGRWSGWRSLGGAFAPGAPVAAVARTSGQLDIFAIGPDGHVYNSSWNGGEWSSIASRAWLDLRGSFSPAACVSAISRTPEIIDVFATATDGSVHTSWWSGSWSSLGLGWVNIGGRFPAGARIHALARKPEQIDLFGMAGDGRVYTNWWSGADWSGFHTSL